MRPAEAPRPRSRDGVGPSCIALPPGPWPTVLDFLSRRFPNVPAEDWLVRLRDGQVVDADGLALAPDAAYRPHHKLYYYRSVAREPRVPFEAEVIYRDEHLVVADKPHFLPVTPGGRHVQETLLVRLKRQLGIDTLSPMHRIDRETAGLVVFTVRPEERDLYHALFRERAVAKHYEAIAPWHAGLVLPTVVRSRLVESLRSFMQMDEAAGAPNAETVVDLIEVAGAFARYGLQPLTGRKHQLRVHMASLGLPILGDRIYPELLPDLADGEEPDYRQPLRLLARRLSFTCPVSGRPHHFESRRGLSF